MTDAIETIWQLDDQYGTYQSRHLGFRIEKIRPAGGLVDLMINGEIMHADLLQVSPDPPTPAAGETIIESYCRANDLIITYAQTPVRSVRPQYQWRIVYPAMGITGVELTLSMQTSLLDSNPRATAFTHIPHAEVLAFDGSAWRPLDQPGPITDSGLFLFRPPGGHQSYAEIVYPADYQGATTSPSVGIELRYELFPEFLEKGVIRKARIQALFGPRHEDQRWARQAQEEFAHAAPPLTT